MVKQIIKEAIEKNPIGLKEAVEAELMSRVQLALEAKKTSMEDDYEEDEDMDESFDLSDYTVEELEDFMMSEDFDQLDEISKKTLRSYYAKAISDISSKTKKAKAAPDRAARDAIDGQALKRRRFVNKAVDRLAIENKISKLDERKETYSVSVNGKIGNRVGMSKENADDFVSELKKNPKMKTVDIEIVKEDLDESVQDTWRVSISGLGGATVKGSNRTQAVDRALSKMKISKSERRMYISGKDKDKVKVEKV